MDELQDTKPHVLMNDHSERTPQAAIGSSAAGSGAQISIWFFCGSLMLVYGIILFVQGIYEHFGHQPATVLASLEPTLWWGVLLAVFGGFYSAWFRPGKR